MRLFAPLPVLAFVLIACSSTPARRSPGPYGQPYPQGYGPPPGQYLPGQYPQAQAYPPGYGPPPQGYPPGYGPPQGYPYGYGPPPQGGAPLPQPTASAFVAPTATAMPAGSGQPTASAGMALAPEVAVCRAAEAKKNDCKVALERTAAAGLMDSKDYAALYKRGCEVGTQLLGCGAFKSSAVTESDHDTMVSLMRCEMGATERCEGLATKSAPLKAWLTTLKTEGCKRGENALCKSHKECKTPSQWSCEPTGAPAAAGQEPPKACGCFPRCASGVAVTLTGKTWPDGSQRAKFTCNAP